VVRIKPPLNQKKVEATRPSNGTNHMIGWGYDGGGNLTSVNGITLNTFNAENQWTHQSSFNISYLYDGDGRRVKSSGGASGTRIYWYDESGQVIMESMQDGSVLNEYLYVGGLRVARVANLGPIYYYYGDHLGTARLITDGGGTKCYDADYFPWGLEQHVYTNSCPQNYKFTGKERDPDTGSDYFGARWYRYDMSRFFSPDWSSTPTGVPYASFADPQTLNLYSYVRNNPLGSVDADGHDWDDALQYAGGVVQGVASSVSFGLIGGPSSNDSAASLSGQLTGSLAVTHISATTLDASGTAALGGLIAAPETGGATLAVEPVAGAAALVSSGTLAGGVKNSAAVVSTMAAKAGTPSSAGKMQKEVEKGQAPESVDRVDKGRGPNEKDHVHFKNRSARNQDGTWKHDQGGTNLSNKVKDWLKNHGWN
jgi:RHS repeat-associated protein